MILPIIILADVSFSPGRTTLDRRIALVLSLTPWPATLSFIPVLFLFAEWVVLFFHGLLLPVGLLA
jgi:hypothetical protein